MTNEELENLRLRAERDEPQGMYEYAQAIMPTNPTSADMYMELAAQLGNPPALEYMGDKHLAEGRYESAAREFKAGAKAGLLDCSVKLAVMAMARNEAGAIKELEELAEAGVRSACVALAEYHKESGNKKQYAYWRSLLK